MMVKIGGHSRSHIERDDALGPFERIAPVQYVVMKMKPMLTTNLFLFL